MSNEVRPFDLPVPRGARSAAHLGLVGAPSPAIGAIVCASSTIDRNGMSVAPDDAPAGLGGRIAFSLFIGVLGGAFLGLPLMLLVANVAPSLMQIAGTAVAAILVLGSAALAFWLSFSRYGKGTREGRVVYAGADGIEAIDYKKGDIERTSVLYAGDLLVQGEHKSVTINGVYSHDLEDIRFRDTKGNHLLTVVGLYTNSVGPNLEALLVREAIALTTQRRLARAKAMLERGEPVTFAILELNGHREDLTSKQLVMRGDDLELHDTAKSPSLLQRFKRASTVARLNQGHIEIVPNDAGLAGVTFKRSLVSDADVLLRLLPSP